MTDNPNQQSETPSKPRSRGLLNPSVVNVVSLIIITICIIIAVSSSIMAVWEYSDTDTLLRTISTVVIIIVGVSLFAKTNRSLGE